MIEYLLAAAAGIALLWIIQPPPESRRLPQEKDDAPRDVHG